MKLAFLPLILSAGLLAAHFLRSNNLLTFLLCLFMPLLLFFKRRWSLIVLQCFSVVAALTWCYTLYWIIQERIYSGRSWFASAFILGLVALFALFSGWLLNTHQKKINSQISSIP